LVGATKYYDLTINAATGTTYILRATPKGAQNGDGILELTIPANAIGTRITTVR
jgi:type IV pilus assembly protein PilE